MKTYLESHAVGKPVIILHMSDDHRTVGVMEEKPTTEESPGHEGTLVGEFPIELVWDMLRDNLIVCDASPTKEPRLFRKKWEALIATRESLRNMVMPSRR